MNPFKIKKRKADTIAAYQHVFATRDGDLILKDLMRTGYFDISSFAEGDPHVTAFREGQRAMVLRILKIINTDPAYVLELLAGQSEE